jgi:hypothetical protein
MNEKTARGQGNTVTGTWMKPLAKTVKPSLEILSNGLRLGNNTTFSDMDREKRPRSVSGQEKKEER